MSQSNGEVIHTSISVSSCLCVLPMGTRCSCKADPSTPAIVLLASTHFHSCVPSQPCSFQSLTATCGRSAQLLPESKAAVQHILTRIPWLWYATVHLHTRIRCSKTYLLLLPLSLREESQTHKKEYREVHPQVPRISVGEVNNQVSLNSVIASTTPLTPPPTSQTSLKPHRSSQVCTHYLSDQPHPLGESYKPLRRETTIVREL